MKWEGATPFEFEGKSMEIETTAWSKFRNGGKATAEQILKSEEINQMSRTESHSQWFK